MAPTHDPLTEEHLAFLNSLPVELTVQEQTHGPKGPIISFLQVLGLITLTPVHVSADPGKTVFRYTRTATPIPGAS